MSLTLTDVELSFPDGRERVRVLDDVHLDVPDGGFVAVTGPSGSGKTSLLSVAGTLVTPDAGAVRIDGCDVAELSAAERAAVRRERLGFVFQQDNLLPALTAVDQLLLVADIRGARPRRHREEAMGLLDEVGLADAAARRPGEMSGGMRQRVNIARALMGSRSLLLIDEPTSALDSDRGRAIVALIARLVAERDLTAVMVSHDLDLLTPAYGVDTTVQLRDGRIGPAVPRAAGPIPSTGQRT